MMSVRGSPEVLVVVAERADQRDAVPVRVVEGRAACR